MYVFFEINKKNYRPIELLELVLLSLGKKKEKKKQITIIDNIHMKLFKLLYPFKIKIKSAIDLKTKTI